MVENRLRARTSHSQNAGVRILEGETHRRRVCEEWQRSERWPQAVCTQPQRNPQAQLPSAVLATPRRPGWWAHRTHCEEARRRRRRMLPTPGIDYPSRVVIRIEQKAGVETCMQYVGGGRREACDCVYRMVCLGGKCCECEHHRKCEHKDIRARPVNVGTTCGHGACEPVNVITTCECVTMCECECVNVKHKHVNVNCVQETWWELAWHMQCVCRQIRALNEPRIRGSYHTRWLAPPYEARTTAGTSLLRAS